MAPGLSAATAIANLTLFHAASVLIQSSCVEEDENIEMLVSRLNYRCMGCYCMATNVKTGSGMKGDLGTVMVGTKHGKPRAS